MSEVKSKKSNFNIAVSTLAMLVLLGNSYLPADKNAGNVFEADPATTGAGTGEFSASSVSVLMPGTAASTTNGGPMIVNGPGEWKVYFTRPNHSTQLNNKKNLMDQEWNNSIEAALIAQIKLATKSIDIAAYELELTPVAEALVAATQKTPKVEVRVITDDEQGCAKVAPQPTDPGRPEWCHAGFLLLKYQGIEVRQDANPRAQMHDKFWIFDGHIVWTGSTNITESGVYDQHNNVIVIDNKQLAGLYEAEFNEMWDDGKFGTSSPKATTELKPAIQLKNKTEIFDVRFTPDSSDKDASVNLPIATAKTATAKSIIPLVQCATKSIHFMAFSFTDAQLAEAMIQRASSKESKNCTMSPKPKETIPVLGIFDSRQRTSDDDFSQIKNLSCKKVLLRPDWTIMHNKVIVVDERYVITGSMNFSGNGNNANDENMIIIDSPAMAKEYVQQFKTIWDLIGQDKQLKC